MYVIKVFFILILFVLGSLKLFAQVDQTIKGTVQDTLGNAVIAATVKLISIKDTVTTRTDANGHFIIKQVKSPAFLLSVTNLGYQLFHKHYTFQDANEMRLLPAIKLQIDIKKLNEITISGAPPITISEDTVAYHAPNYKLREEALAEDLLKKLPGISVDNQGNVVAQGENITKVRINGKDYFGGDIKTATQNLPADIIDKVQVVDDYGDQANITGMKTGDPEKVLDIHIRPEKNKGYVSKNTIAAGIKNRHQLSTMSNYLNDKEQVSILLNFNNTNTSFFNLGAGSNPTGNNSGNGPSANMGNGALNSSMNGITTLSSIGLNYRNNWHAKLTSYGSYSYANNNTDLVTRSIQQNNYQNAQILNNRSSTSNVISSTHRFNWNLEYRIDSLNYLKIIPTLSYNKSNTNAFANYTLQNNGVSSPKINNLQNSGTETPALSANVLYNHRFLKLGRNISLALTSTFSNNTQNQDFITESAVTPYQNQTQKITSNNQNYNSSLSYIEPLNTKVSLEWNYVFNNMQYQNSRLTFNTDANGLIKVGNAWSNDYDYSFTTNRLGINYRVNQKKYNYFLGLGAQPSMLLGSSNALSGDIRKKAFHVIPRGRFSYNFSKSRWLNMGFFAKVNPPSYAQLQPSINQSNPQFPVQGNPNLDVEFYHMMRIRYNDSNLETGDVFFLKLWAMFAQGKIVSNTVKTLSANNTIVQQTNYLNADGYYALTGFYLYSKSFAKRKYICYWSGSANYNNNISYSDGQRNTGQNWILSQSFYVKVNPHPWLEINPGANYSCNINTNNVLTQIDSKVSTWSLTFNSKMYLLKTWLIGTDMSKSINDDYGMIATNPLLLNLYLEKQFFKGNIGALRVAAFDLYNQNASIARVVTANSVTDSRSNLLGRYFMLSFSIRLQKFAGKTARNMLTPSDSIEKFDKASSH